MVTGQDERGRSRIMLDGLAENIKEMDSMPGVALTDLWETLSAPADNSGMEDAAKRPVRLTAPDPGTIFRIVEFPPDSVWRGSANADAAFSSIAAGTAHDDGSSDPMRHKTSTIDYIIVMSGEIYAILDEGEVLLKQGDVFIQRGTMHSWSVRGDQPCIIGVVLVTAKPI
ncbi:MAG TPA: cupin domain-containing protein [Dongiaceae bacterium]|nr:cupin domain-containing protein [Dongiaceae bacterium]